MVESLPTPVTPEAPEPQRGRNPFFPLVAAVSVVFIVTILGLVSTLYGNPEAPVTKWLDENGGRLIGAEILAFVVVSAAALVVDRRQALREYKQTLSARAAQQKTEPETH